MRLLDVYSVMGNGLPVFHELLEDETSAPLPYAILSHTWGKRQDNKDIVFDDIPSSETIARFLDEATQLKQWQGTIDRKKAGFSKINQACRLASRLGFEYIWIDSCCIDKSKSAELNESINSMYRWYKNSARCIVYLEDLAPDGDLRQCRWFKRGWTLQELVAPSKVTFYDSNWMSFGERSDTRFCEFLSSITGIDMHCLQGGVNLGALSIAHRMSWADGRETTVPEDRAYSLMGIFDINMPLIYGEGGTKAFRRLQEEIARVSSDLSIFAWDPSSEPNMGLNAFASRPDEFAAYKDMVPSYQSLHFTRTNKGIEMTTILWRILCEDGKERLMLAIGKQKNGKLDIGIILRKVGHNMYMRRGNMQPFSDEQITSSTRRSTFYLVSPHASTGYEQVLNTSRKRAILIPMTGLGNFRTERSAPEYAWDCEDRLFFNNQHWGGSDWRAIELIDRSSASERDGRFVALFSLKHETPGCHLLRWTEDLSVIFDRRHQTETTRLAEFHYGIRGARNEVDIKSNRARLSIRLVPTIEGGDAGTQFRMEFQEMFLYGSRLPPAINPVMNDGYNRRQYSLNNTSAWTVEHSAENRILSERRRGFRFREGNYKSAASERVMTRQRGSGQGFDRTIPGWRRYQATNGFSMSSSGSVSSTKMLAQSYAPGHNASPPFPSRVLFGPQNHGQMATLRTHETFSSPDCDLKYLRETQSESILETQSQRVLETQSESFLEIPETQRAPETQSESILDPDDSYPFEVTRQPTRTVFSHFEGTGVPLTEAGPPVAFAAMNLVSQDVRIGLQT